MMDLALKMMNFGRLPKDLVLIVFELSVEIAQHIFRLMYRFVLYPSLMKESSYTLQLKDQVRGLRNDNI